MTLPTLKLELDESGVSPANLRTAEPHNAPTRSTRVIKPDFGPYFTKTLKVWSVAGGVKTQLQRGVHFTCVEFFAKASEHLGKEICGALLIHIPGLPDDFELEYQALGGFQNIDFKAMAEAVRDLNSAGITVDWKDILDKPKGFPPLPHKQDSADMYGVEYLAAEVQSLLYAIDVGDDYSTLLLLKEVSASRMSTITALSGLMNAIEAHIQNKINSHGGTTAGQIQLGSVENRHFVPKVVNGTTIEPYSSPRTTFNQIKNALLGDILKHIQDIRNPHHVTAAQVLLPTLQNFPTGSAQDIVDGTSEQMYVTPLAVHDAIPQLAGGILKHVVDFEDPHKTTQTQIGLSDVQNFPFAVDTEVALGVSEERYMAPADVKTQLDNWVVYDNQQRNLHIDNHDDPHNTTKTQIGLPLVENYGLATIADVKYGFATDLYITPQILHDAVLEAFNQKLDLSAIDSAGGAVPLDSTRQIPTRLLTNVADFNDFALKIWRKGAVTADQMIMSYVFTRSGSFPVGFNAVGQISQAAANVGPVNRPVTIELLIGENNRIGTIIFNPSADVGLVSARKGSFLSNAAGTLAFKIGDVLTARVSSTDPTFTDLTINLAGKLDVSQVSNPSGLNTLMPSVTPRPLDAVIFTNGVDDTGASVAGSSKYAIAASTVTAVTTFGSGRVQGASFGNSWKGCVAGGKTNAGAAIATLDEMIFANNSISGGRSIGVARYDAIGFGNENFGIVTGGISSADTFLTTTGKYVYTTFTFAAATALGLAAGRVQGVGNARQAYIRNGSTLLNEFNGTTYYGKYTYASEVLATVSTASTLSRFNAASAGNDTVGVIAGGSYQGDALTTVQRITYATDALGTGTVLSDARQAAAGGGNATVGVFGGGFRTTGVPVDTATLYTYANDTTASATVLAGARGKGSALSSSPGWR